MDIHKDNLEKMASLFNNLDGKPEDQMIAELARIIRTGREV